MNVGMQLREAREARGLSLDALATATRIKARVLEGLERNDLSAAPPRPYARGFVAAYAREVGLDADETARSYFAQFAAPPEPLLPTAPRPTQESPGRSVWVAVAVVVVVAAATAVMMTRQLGAPALPDSGVVGTSGPVAQPTIAERRRVPPGDAVPAMSGFRETPPVVTAAAPTPVVVTLRLERASWVSATADGRRVIYRLMQEGTEETVRASHDIVLRVGNAGAIRWSVNGGPVAAMGGPGEVRSVRVTADR